MSIKTLRKRIALVAVSALGVGLLSVAPASAGANDFVIAANGVGGSIGFVSAVDTTDNAQTVTITSDGSLQFATTAGTDGVSSLTVTGGTISSVSAVTDGSPNAARTSLVYGDVAVTVVVKPNAGATSMVIKSFAATADIATGTTADKITVTVVAASTIGVLSASKSETNWVAYGTGIDNDADADLTNIDVAGANIIANGAVGQIAFSLNDGNGTDLPTSGIISAVSSNPLVAISFDGSFFNTEIAEAVGATNYGSVYVAQAQANTPANATITFKYNGTAYSTKSVTMQGDIKSIVVSDITTGKAGVSGAITAQGSATDSTAATATTDAGTFYVVAKDAAGNLLGGKTVSADTTRYNNVVSAITLSNSGATIKFSATAGLTAGPGTGSLLGTFSCPTSTEGTGGTKQRLKITNAALETIYSNEFDLTCAGSPNTYTASLDKASYVPGDIATLTITVKSAGNIAPFYSATLGTDTTAELSISGSQLTAVVTPQNEDIFGNTGVKTYKFIVGSTVGSYNMIVDLPKWNVAAGYAGAAQTVAYKVASSTTTVTNAEVLASIVKLIASINKQIKALQKSLRR